MIHPTTARSLPACQMPSPLRAMRLLRGLRLVDVADAAGISFTHLSAVERGISPLSVEIASRLSATYGVEVRPTTVH